MPIVYILLKERSSLHRYNHNDPDVALTSEQRAVLDDINASLAEDFALRRRMLLKRVDVTLQSFLWAEKAQGALCLRWPSCMY